jgi:hypothetical protein
LPYTCTIVNTGWGPIIAKLHIMCECTGIFVPIIEKTTVTTKLYVCIFAYSKEIKYNPIKPSTIYVKTTGTSNLKIKNGHVKVKHYHDTWETFQNQISVTKYPACAQVLMFEVIDKLYHIKLYWIHLAMSWI